MPKLDAFTDAYIKAALWSTNDESDESGGEPLDENYSASDIAPETMELIVEDCNDFQQRYSELLADSGIGDARAGHDFWLSRGGHGTGFFDEDTIDEEFQDPLQDAARSYGEFDLYVGDPDADGERLIYGPPPDWYREHHPRGGVSEARRPASRTEMSRAEALDLWRLGNNSGAGYAPYTDVPGEDTIEAAVAAAEQDGWELVHDRRTSDEVAVLRNADGEWIGIGGDAMGRQAWAVILTDVRGRSGETKEARQPILRPRSAARSVRQAPPRPRYAGESNLPTTNIFWRDIPSGSKVELVGHSYVVTKPDGTRASAYWGGQDARLAQRTLDGMAKAGKRLPLPRPRGFNGPLRRKR